MNTHDRFYRGVTITKTVDAFTFNRIRPSVITKGKKAGKGAKTVHTMLIFDTLKEVTHAIDGMLETDTANHDGVLVFIGCAP